MTKRDAHVKAKSASKNGGNWLLVFNCANIGLANCLKLLAPSLQIQSTDFGRFRREFAEYGPRLPDFDLVLAAPNFLQEAGVDFSACERVRTLPLLYFDAYHPDLCYLTDGNQFLKGPLGDYHSKIVTAAYMKHMPESRVRSLFTDSRYSDCGYYQRWNPSRDTLLDRFRNAGCSMDRHFASWSLRGPFMHSVNHPAIRVLHDIARAVLEDEGIVPVDSGVIPHDNLLNGPVYPVFDEIAERLSIAGSYRFKVPGEYRSITLEEFIHGSYRLLDQMAVEKVTVHDSQRESFENVLAVL